METGTQANSDRRTPQIGLISLQGWVAAAALILAGIQWALFSQMLSEPNDLPLTSLIRPVMQTAGHLGIIFVFIGASLALLAVQIRHRRIMFSVLTFLVFAFAACYFTVLPGFHWDRRCNRFAVLLALATIAVGVEDRIRNRERSHRWSTGLVAAAFVGYYLHLGSITLQMD